MQVLKINPNSFDISELEPAAKILQRGGVIAYPTETVYGLGADIYQEAAVERVYKIKARDSQKPISIMIASIDYVLQLVDEITEVGKTLMSAFWPGPLTLIFKSSHGAPKYFSRQNNKIGLRMPDHAITSALMKLHETPITSTSANFSGEAPAVNAKEVIGRLDDKIDLVIDGGESKVKIASTVVDVTGERPEVLREGAISLFEIEQCLQGVTP